MAQEQMAPPPEGQAAPAEGGGSDAEALLNVVSTVDEGLGILNEVIAQMPVGDGEKQALAELQSQFQSLMTAIVQGGGQQAPGQSQAPMEQGAGGQPMNPSIRS